MRKINKVLKTIARREGVSVAEVKKDMPGAINMAYVAPGFYARSVPAKGSIPTVEEFLEYTAQRIQLKSGI